MNQTDKLYQNRNIKKTIRNEDNRHKNLIVPLTQKFQKKEHDIVKIRVEIHKFS